MLPGASGRPPPPDVRERILLRAADEMEARAAELTDLMIAESGSARYKARGEVMGSAGILRVAAGECRRLHGEVLQPGGPGQMSMAVRSPLGVVLGITPFNYPMILAIKKLAYVLAAGNTFILKPSPLTPATGLAIAEVFEAAGLPAGVLNVVPGRSEVIGDMLVDDPRVRMVTFTGSSAVGRSIAVRAARDLKKVAMELGGKNPLIVLKDFDPVQAADIAAYGAFCHQGQVCMATSRIIVEGDGYQPFCDALVRRAEGLKVGDPREEDFPRGDLRPGDVGDAGQRPGGGPGPVQRQRIRTVCRPADPQSGAGLVHGAADGGGHGAHQRYYLPQRHYGTLRRREVQRLRP